MDISKPYTQEDIENILENETEESTYLEFKSAGSIGTNDSAKNEMGKDISGFANADGGVLIYGIREENHVAKELSPIDGDIFTKERIEQILNKRATPTPKYEIDPIRIDGDIKKTIYVIRIQKGTKPCQASDHKYYRRRNFKVDPMEEYEVQDAYFRKSNSILKILHPKVWGGYATTNAEKITTYTFNIEYSILNDGEGLEKDFKLLVKIPQNIQVNQSSHDPNNIRKYWTYSEDFFDVYAIPNFSPIFQHEKTVMINIPLQIDLNTFKELEEKGIRALLYHSNGLEVFDVLPINFLKHKPTHGQEHDLSEKCFKGKH